MKNVFNGEVFFVLFLMAGAFKSGLNMTLDLTVLFFCLSVAISLIRLSKTWKITNLITKPFILYLILILLALISYSFVHSEYSTSKLLLLSTVTLWAFVGPFFIVNPKKPILSLKRMVVTILAVGLGMSLLAVSNIFQEKQVSFVTVLGSNYLMLGRTAAMSLLILLIYFLFSDIGKKKKTLVFLLSLVPLVSLFASGGRMPVIAFFITFFITFLFSVRINFKLNQIKIRTSTLFSSLLLISFSPFLFYYLKTSGFTDKFVYRFNLLFSNDTGFSVTERVNRFNTAIEMIEDSNLLGKGIGSYADYYFTGDSNYPHNIFLELASELGLIGVFLISGLIVVGLYRYFKRFGKELSFYSITIFSLFLFNFINAQVTGDINDNRFLFFTIGLLCISPIFATKSKK